ncbi:MAG: ribose-phosphate pyrophosphokinase [Armatimonadetes bacterium]|nr:MAG: ribose-phosphate pyrophosphokinase [Armatimonadota bacterium]
MAVVERGSVGIGEIRSVVCPHSNGDGLGFCVFKEKPEVCPPLYECRDFVVLSGPGNLQLAQEVSGILHKRVSNPMKKFSDGESLARIPESVRRKRVYILQPGQPDPDRRINETFHMVDAARRSSAGEITVFFPYYPQGRADRKDQPRVSIGGAMFARQLEDRGVHRIVTLDMHAEQLQGVTNIPWDNLYTSHSLLPVLERELGNEDLVVACTDAGGVKRANFYHEELGADSLAIFLKQRDPRDKNAPKSFGMIGDVRGKRVLFLDDVIDTAGTLKLAADCAIENGAVEVCAVAAHGVFSENALDTIWNSPIERVWVTNTIQPRPEVLNHLKIGKEGVVSVAPLVAEIILRIQTGESLSEGLIR